MSKKHGSETPRAPKTGTSRRRFLQVVGIGLVAPSFLKLSACDSDSGTKAKPVTEAVAYFPQGVASGDPRPESVVFWARVSDTANAGDLDVTLVIDTNDDFANPLVEQSLSATADHDHIVKVKVSGLDPATVYFYRFVYEKDGERLGSRVARTKTAPAPDADVEVKLALASCQDFVARYYNSYAKMLQEADALDVVVHIGDYIYETTGDPFFQSEGGASRNVVFSDTAGAIAVKNDAGDITHYAAQSLSNYRELYQAYRSDPWLQRVHERVPFVFIWDDHEFSDDCWGDTATYYDGKVNEDHQTSRRENAERANFEYLPTELGLGTAGDSFDIGTKLPVSDPNVVIYRDFHFGKHVHLILTDTRSYRPDHAIPEDVHFARVALTKDELVATGLNPAALDASGSPFYIPYIDLDAAANEAYQTRVGLALLPVYGALLPDDDAALRARAQTQAVGLWSAIEINKLLAAAITAGDVTALDTSDATVLPRGATFDHLRYSHGRLFASDGLSARYLVEQVHYEAYAKARATRDPATQNIFGTKQETWLRATLQGSTATWKVVATSISMTSMIVDARSMPAVLVGKPDSDLVQSGLQVFKGLLPTAFLLSVDQWDGFPDKRQEILDLMRSLPNCLLLAGDIHSFYATNHGKGDGAHGVVELTGGGISSESFKGFVRGVVDGLVPGISAAPNVAAVISHLEEILQDSYAPLLYANNDAHGYLAVGFSATQANATIYVAPIAHVLVDTNDAAIATAPFEAIAFTVKDGVLTKA